MLTIYQKSLYLTVLNATQIYLSLRKTLPIQDRQKKIELYKKLTFSELECLCNRMMRGDLSRNHIRESIGKIKNCIGRGISFGQTQKGINVLLKYHFFVCHFHDNNIINELDCPLDKIVLKALGVRNTPLADIKKREYEKFQDKIAGQANPRICFDRRWDEQHLRDENLLD